MLDGKPQPDRPAPVLHDDRRVAEVELAYEALDRRDVEVVGVVLESRRLVRAAEAEVVGHDDTRRAREGGNQLPVQERPGRLAVQEQAG